MSLDAEPSSVVSRRGLRVAAAILAIIFIAVVAIGLGQRKTADARLQKWTEEQAVPTVAVAKPDTRGRKDSLDLPGRLEAYSQAQLFARVSGYLKDWKADIGTKVKAGQVLAEIDAPDLDQQMMQARANLASAQANAELAAATLERGQSLMPKGAISKQDLDQRSADANNKRSLVEAMRADLDRTRVLENYKRIVAPFDGLVTARTTDVGALINAGANGGGALFVVSDVSRLRVYVNVPQNFVPSVKVGSKAQLTVPEYPGRTFPATVEASAQSVDAASGTTRMQLVVDNTSGALMTGAYTNVRLELSSPDIAINVPASALIFNQSGLLVATVGDDERIALKRVVISRDLGRVVEIGSGLTPDDRVVESPPDGIADGDRVRIVGRGTSSEAKSAKDASPRPNG
ncbi:MAG: efflux RND transporter periplasmic adaptor subunit [Hyphomicrobiaceae bacterium]